MKSLKNWLLCLKSCFCKTEDQSCKKAENKKELNDLVDKEGDDSFPASDPPSWTLGDKKADKDKKE